MSMPVGIDRVKLPGGTIIKLKTLIVDVKGVGFFLLAVPAST